MSAPDPSDIPALADRFRRLFPDATFVRPDPDARDLTALPPASQHFLTDVGLPDVNFFEFNFKLVATLPSLDEYEAQRRPRAGDHFDRVWCFAENHNQFFGIDTACHGRVDRYDLGGGLEPMFLNSGVDRFAAFLAECWTFAASRPAGANVDEPLRRMIDRMREIDPPGIDGWWSVVIQEFELGLS